MKLLVIGNSHCFALKHANSAADSPFFGRASFLCTPGNGMSLAVEDGVVRGTSGTVFRAFADGVTPDDIVIDEHDVIVLAGLGFQARQALRLHTRGYRLYPHLDGARVPLSRAAYAEALKGLIADCLAIRLATQLRQHTARPMILVPQPKPVLPQGAPVSDYQTWLVDTWAAYVTDPSQGQALDGVFERAALALGAELSFRVAFQAEETLDRRFTKPEYRIGRRISFDDKAAGAQFEELTHMNADYGAVVMGQIAAMVAG